MLEEESQFIERGFSIMSSNSVQRCIEIAKNRANFANKELQSFMDLNTTPKNSNKSDFNNSNQDNLHRKIV